MRPHRTRLALATALALGALGTSLAGGSPAGAQRAPRLAPSSPAPAVVGAPAVAATHRVRMVGDEKGYRFEPARLTVAPGDRVVFVMVSGGPHNVQFDERAVPDAGKRALGAGMPDTVATLTSPMFLNAGETYTVSFAGVPAGEYPYVCTPHQAMNMAGTITVRGGRRPAARSGRPARPAGRPGA